MEFNEKLQELRKQKGLTQEELAKELYVSRTAISKWESGRGYPSIESLKMIASFFSVTVDQLLSSNEVLNLAEEDERQKAVHIRNMVFGLLDILAVLLLFLPLFASRNGEEIRESSLLALSGVELYLKILFFVLVIGTFLVGVMTHILQCCQAPLWIKIKTKLSIFFSIASVVLFTLALHPYAAVFVFSLLAVKSLMLIKHI